MEDGEGCFWEFAICDWFFVLDSLAVCESTESVNTNAQLTANHSTYIIYQFIDIKRDFRLSLLVVSTVESFAMLSCFLALQMRGSPSKIGVINVTIQGL